MAAPSDSAVKICNRVLTRLGHARLITSLSDDEREARILDTNYEYLRDAFNASHPWNWAIKRATLAIDAGEVPNHEFTNAFTLPNDFMDLVRDANEAEDIYGEFRIEGDHILTDESTLKIEYLARKEDLNEWSMLAREAFTTYLMAKCGPGIRDNLAAASIDKLDAIYQREWLYAKSVDAQQGTPREFVTNIWLGSRNQFQGTGAKISDFYA